MKKKISVIIAYFFCAISSFGQQNIEFSQYMLNLCTSNPAAVGNNDMINVFGTFRSQHAGYEGAPLTYIVSADIGFNIGKTKHGAGISFYDNTAGLFRFQDVNVQYAYRFPILDGYLSGGVIVDFTTVSIDKDKIHQAESEYHDAGDPAIDKAGNDFKMDLGVGFLFKNKKWFAGISLLNVLSPEYELSEKTFFNKTMNLKFVGGYNISFNNPLYKLKTSTMVNTDFVSWSGIINANLEYKDSYWGGIGYRIDGAVVFMAGIRVLNGLVIGYSFDLPTSKLIQSAGSHEIVLSYSFNIDFLKKNRYKSIRYL